MHYEKINYTEKLTVLINLHFYLYDFDLLLVSLALIVITDFFIWLVLSLTRIQPASCDECGHPSERGFYKNN